MKVSVIVTSYNRKYELRRALESVYAQTYKPDEIILIDDSVYDESGLNSCADYSPYSFPQKNVKEYLDGFGFKDLKYYKSGHVGPGAARNYGIEKAQGDYIAFLDSDNEWDKDKLERVVGVAERCPEADVISCHYKYYEEFAWKVKPNTVEPSIRHTIRKPDEDEVWVYGIPNDRILVQNVADASATIYKREFFERIGGFSETMVTNIDWELMLRARKIAKAEKWELRVILLDWALSDNHTMYDSLSENLEIEMKERLALFAENKEEIFDKKLCLEYYNQFLLDKNVRMNKQQAVEQLFKVVSYDARFMLALLHKQQEEIDNLQNKVYRKSRFYELLYAWLLMKMSGSLVASKLTERNISSIGIYGAGRHGKLLFQELRNSNVEILFFVDCNIKKIVLEEPIPILGLDDKWPKVDAIIVSTFLEVDSLRLSIEKKGVMNVIPLNEILE